MKHYVNFDIDNSFIHEDLEKGVLVKKEKISLDIHYSLKVNNETKKVTKRSHVTVASFDLRYGIYGLPREIKIPEWILPFEDLEVGREYVVIHHHEHIDYAICVFDWLDYEKISEIERLSEQDFEFIDTINGVHLQEQEDWYNAARQQKLEEKYDSIRDYKNECKLRKQKNYKKLRLEPELSGADNMLPDKNEDSNN